MDDGTEHWRSKVAAMQQHSPKGWASRERVYRALARQRPEGNAVLGTLFREAGVSKSTFFARFGGVDGDPIEGQAYVVATAEAKEWSWVPYAQGLAAARAQAAIAARPAVDAAVRALAQWALDHPGLARQLDHRPPSAAAGLLAALLRGVGGDPPLDDVDELTRVTVRRALDETQESSLGVLNAVRPRIEALLARPAGAVAGDQVAVVVQVLSDYARHVLAGNAPPAAIDELLPSLDRLRDLLRQDRP